MIGAIWAKIAHAEPVTKAEGDDSAGDDQAKQIADQLDLAFVNELSAELLPIYREQASASAAQALNQVAAVAKVKGTIDKLLEQADVKAIAWADIHAANAAKKEGEGEPT